MIVGHAQGDDWRGLERREAAQQVLRNGRDLVKSAGGGHLSSQLRWIVHSGAWAAPCVPLGPSLAHVKSEVYRGTAAAFYGRHGLATETSHRWPVAHTQIGSAGRELVDAVICRFRLQSPAADRVTLDSRGCSQHFAGQDSPIAD